MALKSMGVVKNYERVRDFSVAIVGIGGVGIGVCEMLTRCGVGKIVIYDFDTIELANMNRMFYRPEQAGWSKTMAARHYCSELCPDTIFEVHNMDITVDENRPKLKDTIAHGAIDRTQPVNLIIGCVDNLAARQARATAPCSTPRALAHARTLRRSRARACGPLAARDALHRLGWAGLGCARR
jgi:ubiquitin-like modifier-activating enzyme 5